MQVQRSWAMEERGLDESDPYREVSSAELLRSYLNLQLLGCSPLVSAASRLLLSEQSKLLRGAMLLAVRHTTFPYFCAGENLKDVSRTLSYMWNTLRMQGILNFAVEDAFDDHSCHSNFVCFLDSIRRTSDFPTGSVSFSCVKITAICPVPLLERVSSLLRYQQIHPSFDLPWQEENLPIFAPESPKSCFQNEPEPLTTEEEQSFAMAKQRLWQLCIESLNVGVPLLVDAEYLSVQPAIDYLTYAATIAFNKHGEHGTTIYGTMQAYLKDSFPRLKVVMDAAARRDVPLGTKLVRGAYMTREQALAESLGKPSPVHDCIEDTHKCYDSSAGYLLEKAAAGYGRVVLATHNSNSGRITAAKAFELGLTNRDSRVQYGQLRGMADSLSLMLVRAGFRVSKYLAYGPLEHVVPYLIRRADENKGVANNAAVDRWCIRQELYRRLLKLRR